MPSIITFDHFNKNNDLYLPLAVQQITSSYNVASPNSQKAITDLIAQIERDILLNALGLTEYNLLQVALNNLSSASQKWKDLVNGVEYDDKVWDGLKYEHSLLAYAVKYFYLNQNTQFITSVGVAVPNSENAQTVNPDYKLVNAWTKFIEKYQGGYNGYPDTYYKNGAFVTDWIGTDDRVNVSFYQYLIDKKDDFGFSSGRFLVYEGKNTFGI